MIWAVYPYLVVVLHSSKSLKRLSDCSAAAVCTLKDAWCVNGVWHCESSACPPFSVCSVLFLYDWRMVPFKDEKPPPPPHIHTRIHPY